MLLQTNSYVVPKEKRAEHARLVRRFRQTLAKIGCDHFEVYEQVSTNWAGEGGGRCVQIMRFRDRKHQTEVQAAERTDPAAQSLIREFCELINFPYQQQQGLFAVGFYLNVLPTVATPAEEMDPELAQAASKSPEPQWGALAPAVVKKKETASPVTQAAALEVLASQQDEEAEEWFSELADDGPGNPPAKRELPMDDGGGESADTTPTDEALTEETSAEEAPVDPYNEVLSQYVESDELEARPAHVAPAERDQSVSNGEHTNGPIGSVFSAAELKIASPFATEGILDEDAALDALDGPLEPVDEAELESELNGAADRLGEDASGESEPLDEDAALDALTGDDTLATPVAESAELLHPATAQPAEAQPAEPAAKPEPSPAAGVEEPLEIPVADDEAFDLEMLIEEGGGQLESLNGNTGHPSNEAPLTLDEAADELELSAFELTEDETSKPQRHLDAPPPVQFEKRRDR